jgi:hypothetical protein
MEYYIIADLIKYIISDYIPYNIIKHLNPNIFIIHKDRYTHNLITINDQNNIDIFKIIYRQQVNGLKYSIDNQIIYYQYFKQEDWPADPDIYNTYKQYTYSYKNIKIISYYKNNKLSTVTKENKQDDKSKIRLHINYNFDNSLSRKIYYVNNQRFMTKYYNEGFLHIVWIKDICYHLYQNPYRIKNFVCYWWENYISVKTKYYNNKKEYSKYYDADGNCKRHKIYKEN